MGFFDDAVDYFDDMRESVWGRVTTSEFIRFIDPQPSWHVLDVGSGAGNLAFALAPYVGAVKGVDQAPRMIERAREKCTSSGLMTCDFVVGDAKEMPFGDGEFDLITLSAVFYLLANQAQAAEEISRVLKPDGVVALHEPTPKMTLQHMQRFLRREGYLRDVPDLTGWARAAVAHSPLTEESILEVFEPFGLRLHSSRRLLDGMAVEARLVRGNPAHPRATNGMAVGLGVPGFAQAQP